MAYRYAKSIDDAASPGVAQQSRPAGPQYIYHLRGVRSPSSYDVTQRFTLWAFYDVPLAAAPASRAWRKVFAGWSVAAAAVLQSGFPFTPELARNGLNNGGTQLPDRVGGGSLPAGERSHLQWFNATVDRRDPAHAFETPFAYQYGNSGYNILRGPGLAVVDAALSRSFALANGLSLRLRGEAYNLFNRVNLGMPNRILELESSGAISYTATPARQFQFAARLQW